MIRPRRLNVDYVKKDVRLDVDMELKYQERSEEEKKEVIPEHSIYWRPPKTEKKKD